MRGKSEEELDEQIEQGKQLFKIILDQKHNGNMDEMYQFFKDNIERIDIYGDTIEKKLVNYCTFKSDMVAYIYSKRKH